MASPAAASPLPVGYAAPPPPPGNNCLSLEFDPGKATEWTAEELAVSEHLHNRYASMPMLLHLLKIAKQLPGKMVRDVELRCMWIDENASTERKKDNQEPFQQRRKGNQEVHDHLKKRIEKDAPISLNASSHSGVDATVPSHPSEPPTTNDQFWDLLRQNEDIFGQISVNVVSNQIVQNVELFVQARENINALWNGVCKSFCEMNNHNGCVPLPTTKIHEELYELFLLQRDSSKLLQSHDRDHPICCSRWAFFFNAHNHIWLLFVLFPLVIP